MPDLVLCFNPKRVLTGLRVLSNDEAPRSLLTKTGEVFILITVNTCTKISVDGNFAP